MRKYISFLTVAALILSAAFTGCKKDKEVTTEKVVAEIYRFKDGFWWSSEYEGTVTINATSITTSSAVFNFSNVYTSENEEFNDPAHYASEKNHFWAYLYDGSGKIGIAILYGGGRISLWLGLDECIGYAEWLRGFGQTVDIAGMQNDIVGSVVFIPE